MHATWFYTHLSTYIWIHADATCEPFQSVCYLLIGLGYQSLDTNFKFEELGDDTQKIYTGQKKKKSHKNKIGVYTSFVKRVSEVYIVCII